MDILEVTQKTMRTRIEVIVKGLRTMKGNTLFKKRVSHLVTYESGPSKTQVGYCLVSRNKRKFLKDMIALPSENCISQHKPSWYVILR